MFKSNLKIHCGKATWLIAAVISFYYAIVILFSRNFPIIDDFALVDFITNIATSSDLTRKLWLLFAQHNEHRILTPKLLYLFDYWLFGGIYFRHLILIGNIFLLGIFYIFINESPKKSNQRSFLCIFTACMVFQFESAESMLCSMTAVTNYLVIVLALLTLTLLSKDGLNYHILAVLAGVLTVFTQGNGILILPIAIAYLISQKRYRDSLIMAVLTLIVICVYFVGYQVPLKHSNPMDSFQNLGKILIFAVSFTGSALGVGGSHYPVLTTLSLVPTLTLGALIWVITGYSFYKKTYSDGNIFIWFNLFVIMTAIITAMSRINFGLSMSMLSRYHIYSNLVIISTLPLALKLPPMNQFSSHALDRFLKILAVSSVIYLIATFVFVPYFYFVVYSPIGSDKFIYPDRDRAIEYLESAKKAGVFIPQ